MCSAGSWAYSVLTHEEIVDLLWTNEIQPLLLKRYTTHRAAGAPSAKGVLVDILAFEQPLANKISAAMVAKLTTKTSSPSL
jgi:hypothetical protein